MTPLAPEFLDDEFHGCAWADYIELAAICKGTPDVEATRLRACQLYEETLSEKNRERCPSSTG